MIAVVPGVCSIVERRRKALQALAELWRFTYANRTVTPAGGPGSHLIGDLATADCLIVVPEDQTSVLAGDQVQVLRLDEEF